MAITSAHVDYVSAYENGWKDGQKALTRYNADRADDRRQAQVSLECAIAWLKNGNDVPEAIEELKLVLEQLKRTQ